MKTSACPDQIGHYSESSGYDGQDAEGSYIMLSPVKNSTVWGNIERILVVLEQLEEEKGTFPSF